MADNVFAEYKKHEISSKSEIIIPKEIADKYKVNNSVWKERNDNYWVQLK